MSNESQHQKTWTHGKRPFLVVLAVLSALILLLRVLFFPDGPWEQDEALFAGGVLDYSLARHLPHPPGFPGWILLGRLANTVASDPLLALRLMSAMLSTATFVILTLLCVRIVQPWAALASAILFSFLPGVLIYSPRAYSTTPAIAFAAFSLWLFLSRQDSARWIAGWLVLGASFLIRPQLVPVLLLLGVFAALRQFRRPLLLLAGILASFSEVALAYAFVIYDTGGLERFVRVCSEHGSGHLGALGSQGFFAGNNGLITCSGGLLPGVLWFAGTCFGLILLARKKPQSATWCFLLGVATTATVMCIHDPTTARYSLAIFATTIPGVAVSLEYLGKRSCSILVALACAASLIWSLPKMEAAKKVPIPPIAAARHLHTLEKDSLTLTDQGLRSFVRFERLTSGFQGAVEDERIVLIHHHVPPGAFYYLRGESGRMLDGPTVIRTRFGEYPEGNRIFSKGRFFHASLFKWGVLLGAGCSEVRVSSQGEEYSEVGSSCILYGQPGAQQLGMAIDAVDPPHNVILTATIDGETTVMNNLDTTPKVVRISLPESAAGRPINVALESTDAEVCRAQLSKVWLEGPEIPTSAFSVSPGDPRQATRAGVELRGFHDSESFKLGVGAWSLPRAELTFPAHRGILSLSLTMPCPLLRPVVIGNGLAEMVVDVSEEKTEVRVPIEAPDGTARVTLSTRAFVPSDHDKQSSDGRQLGVVLLQATYQPQSSSGN